MSVLEVKNLRKSFGKTEVLKDISFSVEKGELIGYIGPNGALNIYKEKGGLTALFLLKKTEIFYFF